MYILFYPNKYFNLKKTEHSFKGYYICLNKGIKQKSFKKHCNSKQLVFINDCFLQAGWGTIDCKFNFPFLGFYKVNSMQTVPPTNKINISYNYRVH